MHLLNNKKGEKWCKLQKSIRNKLKNALKLTKFFNYPNFREVLLISSGITKQKTKNAIQKKLHQRH